MAIPALTGWVATLITGTTGTGKSMVGEHLCELEYLNRGDKIVDLQNNKYLEGIGFMRRTRIPKFQNTIEKIKQVADDELRAKIEKIENGFPIEVYHPLAVGVPSRLPPAVKLYTIPVDFFGNEDVLRVITNDSLSDAAYTAISQNIEKVSLDESLPAVPLRILESVEKKILKTTGMGVPLFFYTDMSKTASTANRPFLKIKNLGIFSSRMFPHCLTDEKLRSILLDRETITIFSTRWINERHKKMKWAINLWLLVKIREIAKEIGGGIVVYIREGRELFPSGHQNDKAKKVLAEIAEDIVKDCRKAGLRLVIDTQSEDDLPSGVLSQCSHRFIMRHDVQTGKLFDILANTPGLSRNHIENIRKLHNYRFYVSYPGCSIERNPLRGNTLNYKFSDHLEERENELQLMYEVYEPDSWYKTKPVLDMLKADWKATAEAKTKKIQKLHEAEEIRITAKLLGFNTENDLKVLKWMYQHGNVARGFMEVFHGVSGMSKSTCHAALGRLAARNMIEQLDNGDYVLTPAGADFVEANIDAFFTEKELEEYRKKKAELFKAGKEEKKAKTRKRRKTKPKRQEPPKFAGMVEA